jgi:hypothetical protein
MKAARQQQMRHSRITHQALLQSLMSVDTLQQRPLLLLLLLLLVAVVAPLMAPLLLLLLLVLVLLAPVVVVQALALLLLLLLAPVAALPLGLVSMCLVLCCGVGGTTQDLATPCMALRRP